MWHLSTKPLWGVSLLVTLAIALALGAHSGSEASGINGPRLQDVPVNCPPGPMPEQFSPYFGHGLGGFPVWAIGLREYATLLFPRDMEESRILTDLGYGTKILFALEREYEGSVILHGANLEDDTPLWFRIGDREPTTSPLLDPLDPPIPYQHEGWSDFPSNVFIPQAGCYYLEAATEAGTRLWRFTFSAGREPDPTPYELPVERGQGRVVVVPGLYDVQFIITASFLEDTEYRIIVSDDENTTIDFDRHNLYFREGEQSTRNGTRPGDGRINAWGMLPKGTLMAMQNPRFSIVTLSEPQRVGLRSAPLNLD